MLYIFQVDTGTMMTFEMNLALESVGQLKDVIEKTRRIPVDKQVLLVSGGECLDPCAKVCSYSAGTDTNPIFLFSKSTLEKAKPPSPSVDFGSDSDMKELVEHSLEMPATYNTIKKRAQIAQQFCELAREHTLVCESLVHEQHLQQQGWAAAVANLEDITAAFKTKSEMFEQNYKQYLETREESLKMLHNYDLQVLARIPILEPLVGNALNFCNLEEKKKQEDSEEKEKSREEVERSSRECSQELGAMTLLMWISKADNQSSLQQVAEQAQRGLEQFDEKVLDALIKEVEATLEKEDKSEMKEIKGLEERLFGLEQLMAETKKIVQEQNDLGQALLQNQTRAGSLNDPSVLPDLCASHRKQLVVMLQNQNLLSDIRSRCSKSKKELGCNLYYRLGWVMYVENSILDVSNKLMIYHENLKRLRKYLEITRQVQRTPQVYAAAVSEVVRRRTFSQAFLSWASDLSCRLLAVYNEEYEKRKDFQSQFEGHFLQCLFPGLEDTPPPFATQAPAPFDVALPKLTVKDMEQLKVYLPDLPMSLSVTKLSNIAQMFLCKSITEGKPLDLKANDSVEEQLVVAVTEAGLGCKLDKTFLQPAEPEGERRKKTSIAKDDKDFESETDTEEFEKVCQSPVEVKSSSGSKFEGNSESPKNEVQTLRNHLTEAGKLANETAVYLKTELIEMKSQSLTDKETILALVKDIQTHISHLTRRYSEEVEALHSKLQEVSRSKNLELQSLKKMVDEKEEVNRNLTQDLSKVKKVLEDAKASKEEISESLLRSQQCCQDLKTQLEDCVGEKTKIFESLSQEYSRKIEEYEEWLNKAKDQKEKAVTEERERLNHEHNATVEEMRSLLVRTELDSEMEKEKTVAELQQKFELDLSQKLEDVRKEMTEEAEAKRQKALKELADKLTLEYKTEMENLRTRFKLMSAANMEKSPSDSSLEKIERLDMIELVNHEAIVAELKEIAVLERENAVKEALELESEKWRLKLEGELKAGKARMEEEKQIWLKEAVNRALADKNTQIEMLKSRQETLLTECQKHKDTIRLLTDEDHIRSASCPGPGTVDLFPERVEVLDKEKSGLAAELDRKKPRRVTETRHVDDMSTSVAVVPVTDVLCRDAATSPEPSGRGDSTSREKLPKSASACGKISITSCSVGDAVLVVWNLEHANYTILQQTPTLYFLHSDCLDSLGLRPSSDGSPRRLYCTAEVVDKEYCHAKKSENRYKVLKGTKFYRVKVRPMTHAKDSMTKSCHQQQQGRPGVELGVSQRLVEAARSLARQSLAGSLSSSQFGAAGAGEGEEPPPHR